MAHFQRGLKSLVQKYPQDVVFVSALRTPFTRSYKGALREAYPEQLLATLFHAIRSNFSQTQIQINDVAIGTVLSELGGSKAARAALNHTRFPVSTSLYTVNRACASGLQAVTSIANSIAIGEVQAGIAGGMESMTRNYGSKAIPVSLWSAVKNSPVVAARDCIMPMGLTSENVSERYGVSRHDQDQFAVLSHAKASKAQREGLFEEEIVPVTIETEQDGQKSNNTVFKDDGIREGVTAEKLALLKPAFKEGGSSTAGNSSQITDGAGAVLMMQRDYATRIGLQDFIIGKWVGSQVTGVSPDEMGVGPAVAIPQLLERTGVQKEDVDVWEINEAFASQALYCIRTLGIDMDKVNPRGGAIALGHPLGATGVRQLVTLLSELGRQAKSIGVISMCVGTGMGYASLVIRE